MPVSEKTALSPDPLASIGMYHETPTPANNLQSISQVPEAPMVEVNTQNVQAEDTSAHAIPDWLKPVQKDPPKWNKDDSDSIVIKSSIQDDPLTQNPITEAIKDDIIIANP